MKKVESLWNLRGNLGGANFYKKDGKNLIREKGGVDGERIKNAPEFKRIRDNNQEFGVAMSAAHKFRKGVIQMVKLFGDNSFASKLGTKLLKMVKAGLGNWGERTLEVVNQGAAIIGVEFNKMDSFTGKFAAPFTFTPAIARNEVTLDIPVFDPRLLLTPPPAAQYFRMTTAVYALTDFSWDANEKLYKPVNPDLLEVHGYASSAELPLNAVTAQPITLTASLTGLPPVPATAGLVAMIGIEFFVQINGSYFRLESGNAMMIANVF